MYLKLVNGTQIDLGDPTAVRVVMIPGSDNFHIAVFEGGSRKLILSYDTWEMAHLRKHQLYYIVVNLGKNAKIHEETYSIVEDS